MLCCPFCEELYSLRRIDIDRDYLMFRRSHVQEVLYSKNICSGHLFRKSYIQKLDSIIRRFYVQRVLYSESPMFRKCYVQIYLIKRSHI